VLLFIRVAGNIYYYAIKIIYYAIKIINYSCFRSLFVMPVSDQE